MSLKIKKKGKSSIPPMDAGTYPAVCVGVIDLGEQFNEHFKKYVDELLFLWEIPSQRLDVEGESKPRWQSMKCRASLNEKSNLFKMLVSWRGKSFSEGDLEEDENGFCKFSVSDMLGEPCLLSVTQVERENGVFNQIGSVVGMIAGMPAPVPESPLLKFDMEAWDDEVFQALPEWVQERIKKSTQYQKQHAPEDSIDFPSSPDAQNRTCPI